ncbi:MAG: DUF2970 domain-containing protein [Candidatus Competibacteraceae bacterium]|nr:DUF2970 domain-containing protein [Candidatus Competibacteraceae bacterium]MCB1809278.1 DUF2970 domain-containing protein [Candidatus Competibacteraceae bacterium]MCB1810275.1 DUF2970 domain-containing protein [Candidatus Competibacteraceae bacterium]
MTDKQKPSALQIISSVLSSFIGVQSNKNRERDFKHGRVVHFIIAGVVLTVLFILVVYSAVQFALSTAGG